MSCCSEGSIKGYLAKFITQKGLPKFLEDL